MPLTRKVTPCPDCGSDELFRSKDVSAGGGHAPNFLPGLGGVFTSAKFTLVVCKRCGLTRFYANAAARGKLPKSHKWTKALR